MKKLKVYENEKEMLELSLDEAESLICKQLLNPVNDELTTFVYENFEDKWFKNEEKQDLFKIGKAYFKNYENVPSENTFKSILKNKKFESKYTELSKEYKNIISFNEISYDEKYIKEAIIKFTKNRSIYFTILEQVEEIEETGEIGDCLSRFEKIVQLDLSDDLGIEYFENLENHCNELISVDDRQPFGYEELDKYTYGGLPTHDACLFIIMAQPGLGKSQLMMNIAYNWVMNNKKVLMVSLEMSEDMYSRRMDGLFSDLNVNRLKENVGVLKSRVKGVKSNLPNGSLRIKEFPTGTFTAGMLKQYLKKLKATKHWEPDIIFVDYLNIMKPNGGNPNMGLYEKCARISEELRAISCILKVPIVSAVQANRCVLKSSIVIEKHRGKIQIADVNVGDELLSDNGIFNKVLKKYKIEKAKTYKIKTKSGKEIVCTNIHEWPTLNGLKSISSGLNIGDKLKKRNLFVCIAETIAFYINKIKSRIF